MAKGDRFARLSSARRRREGPGGVVLALVGLAAVAVVLVALRPRPPVPQPAPSPPPPARPTAAATASPSPTPPPTATPAPVARLSDWVEAARPTATAPPWPSSTPAPATPAVAPPVPVSCVEATWSAQQGLGRLGEVLVEIELKNRCERELGQLEVWFKVTGYRDGAVVQSVCGHPFETVYPGRWSRVTIGLPGSLDWYDRVEVEYTGESCR